MFHESDTVLTREGLYYFEVPVTINFLLLLPLSWNVYNIDYALIKFLTLFKIDL